MISLARPRLTVEHPAQRCGARRDDRRPRLAPAARLALAQGDRAAVVCRPGQTQEIGLSLTRVQGENQRPLHLDRRHTHECGDVVGQPDDLAAVGVIEPLEAAQVIGGDMAALDRPRFSIAEMADSRLSASRSGALDSWGAPAEGDSGLAPPGNGSPRSSKAFLSTAFSDCSRPISASNAARSSGVARHCALSVGVL
jgi:hypothetical protein